MKRFALLVAFVAVAVLTRATIALADEPSLTIRPPAQACNQPFEVTATGLQPLKPVEVLLAVNGTPAQGSVGGQSDETGRFWSPIPMILIPCAAGGEVVATIKVDGQLVPVSARFEVLRPGSVAPTAAATPRGPAAGNTAPAPSQDGERDTLFLLAVAALVLAAGASALARRRTQ